MDTMRGPGVGVTPRIVRPAAAMTRAQPRLRAGFPRDWWTIRNPEEALKNLRAWFELIHSVECKCASHWYSPNSDVRPCFKAVTAPDGTKVTADGKNCGEVNDAIYRWAGNMFKFAGTIGGGPGVEAPGGTGLPPRDRPVNRGEPGDAAEPQRPGRFHWGSPSQLFPDPFRRQFDVNRRFIITEPKSARPIHRPTIRIALTTPTPDVNPEVRGSLEANQVPVLLSALQDLNSTANRRLLGIAVYVDGKFHGPYAVDRGALNGVLQQLGLPIFTSMYDHIGVGNTHDPRAPEADVWPGVTYPWGPMPWVDPTTRLDADRICLGPSCWNVRRMAFFEGCSLADALMRKSWPLRTAASGVRALYDAGYLLQARAVADVYGCGGDGIEKFRDQIRATYSGANCCDYLGPGVPVDGGHPVPVDGGHAPVVPVAPAAPVARLGAPHGGGGGFHGGGGGHGGGFHGGGHGGGFHGGGFRGGSFRFGGWPVYYGLRPDYYPYATERALPETVRVRLVVDDRAQKHEVVGRVPGPNVFAALDRLSLPDPEPLRFKTVTLYADDFRLWTGTVSDATLAAVLGILRLDGYEPRRQYLRQPVRLRNAHFPSEFVAIRSII